MISGSKNSSRIKKNKQSSAAFAKDPKQVVLLAVVLVVFIVAVVHAMAQMNPSTDSALVPPQSAVNPNTATQGVDTAVTPQDTATMSGQAPQDASASNMSQDANDIYSQTVNLQNNQKGSASSSVMPSQSSSDSVDIMPQKKGKMVSIVVGNSGRVNPFLPQSESGSSAIGKNLKMSNQYLMPPPEVLQQDSDAGKVMTTVVSGILYDKYSPSAILNIEGTDYLFKKGDVVNHYKVLSISPTQVVVQLGRNVYQAGVGQLLSPTALGKNMIANLNKKFGGNDSVSIKVKKKVKKKVRKG